MNIPERFKLPANMIGHSKTILKINNALEYHRKQIELLQNELEDEING